MAGGWVTGPGLKAAAGGLGIALASGAGWLLWQGRSPDPAPPAALVAPGAMAPDPAAAIAPDPAAATAPSPADPQPASAAAPAAADAGAAPVPPDPAASAASAPAAPVITTWAVTATGSTVVSGSAPPGAALSLRIDGAEVVAGSALPTGEYALLAQLAPNPDPSLMTLVMLLPEGGEVPAAQTVALGPIADLAGQALSLVDPPAPPAALLLTEAGAVLAQDGIAADPPLAGAAAQAPVALAVETISYAPDGGVQIGGAAMPEAALRVYLDDAPRGETRADGSGKWRMTLPDVAPGLYTLRIDQLDQAGKVVARVETPFQRETPERLAEAAGLAPPAPDSAAVPAAPMADPDGPAIAAAPGAPASAAPTAAPASDPVTVADSIPVTAPPVAPSAPPPVADAVPPAPVTITVQPGHSLWAIAQGQLGQGVLYVQVFEANRDKIRDPDLIYPGQVFTLPGQ